MRVDPVVSLTLFLALAALFAAAAVHKLRDWKGFLGTLAAYRLLPARLLAAAAVGLCLAELAVAAGMAMTLRGAAAAGAGLLVLYALAMAANLLRGRRLLDCGCGGPPQPLSWALVVRNGVLAATSLALFTPAAGRGLGWLDAVTVAAALAALAALYGAVNALVAAGTRLGEGV